MKSTATPKSTSKLTIKLSQEDQENMRIMAAIHGIILDDQAWIQLFPQFVDFESSNVHSGSSSSDTGTATVRVTPPDDSCRLANAPTPPVVQDHRRSSTRDFDAGIIHEFEGELYEFSGTNGIWVRSGGVSTDRPHRAQMADVAPIHGDKLDYDGLVALLGGQSTPKDLSQTHSGITSASDTPIRIHQNSKNTLSTSMASSKLSTNSKPASQESQAPRDLYSIRDAEFSSRGLICMKVFDGQIYEATGVAGIWIRKENGRSGDQNEAGASDSGDGNEFCGFPGIQRPAAFGHVPANTHLTTITSERLPADLDKDTPIRIHQNSKTVENHGFLELFGHINGTDLDIIPAAKPRQSKRIPKCSDPRRGRGHKFGLQRFHAYGKDFVKSAYPGIWVPLGSGFGQQQAKDANSPVLHHKICNK